MAQNERHDKKQDQNQGPTKDDYQRTHFGERPQDIHGGDKGQGNQVSDLDNQDPDDITMRRRD